MRKTGSKRSRGSGEINFKDLAAQLLSSARELLPAWLPGGRVEGSEYCCSDITGGPGKSFRVNLNTGKWADFADSSIYSGGDLISLYAAIYKLSQIEAARTLTGQPARVDEELGDPPPGTPAPAMIHNKYGKPAQTWRYNSRSADHKFYVARYDTLTGKQYVPWTWSKAKKKFVSKAYPKPRPLYNLHQITTDPASPVLIVEGEKAADAADEICGHVYTVTTWSGGALAHGATDFSPIYGRNILIWPDNDEPGIRAAQAIANKLSQFCPNVKVLDPTGKADGWDAADALALGWDYNRFYEWGKSRACAINTEAPAIEQPIEQPQQVTNILAVGDEALDHPMSDAALETWAMLGIPVNRNGTVTANLANINTALEGLPHFKEFVHFDEFHIRYRTTWSGNCKQTPLRDWNEIDDLHLTKYFQQKLGMSRASVEMCNQAMRLYAHGRVRNEPQEWLKSKEWDGRPRIESFFRDYLGADDSLYTHIASKNFWIGLVARILNPGCQLDTMVVLYGGQGIFKTTTARIIGGPWFAEIKEKVSSKDFLVCLQGKLLIEISELHAFKNADMSSIKSMITCRSDYFRLPYARTSHDFPRKCVFIGTTNNPLFLQDETGGRRFIPVCVGKIDPEKIERDREQLFAEARIRFEKGEDWWLMPEATEEMQEQHRQQDDWESEVEFGLLGREIITSLDIAKDILKFETKDIDRAVTARICKILAKLGYKSKAVRQEGIVTKKWVRM